MQQAVLETPAAMRRALIKQRECKAPGDGLLFDQKQLANLNSHAQPGIFPLSAPVSEDMQAHLEVGVLFSSPEWNEGPGKACCNIHTWAPRILNV